MQETSRKTNPRSPEQWKRKFYTETKVNQELARRLRDMKEQLNNERASAESLRAEVDSLKAAENNPERPTAPSCVNCEKLQLEIARLRGLLSQNSIPVDPSTHVEVVHPVIHFTAIQPGPLEPPALHQLRRSHSILVRQQSGRIQCLRDMLDDLTPRLDTPDGAPRRNSNVMIVPLSTPQETPTKSAEISKPAQIPPTSVTSKLLPPQSSQPEPVTPPSKSSTASRVVQSVAVDNTLHGIEDKSLGDLFKYAIVLTGPMSRPKRSALSAFLKAADFRRAKSLQDAVQNGEQLPARKSSFAPGMMKDPNDAGKSKPVDRAASMSPATTNASSPLVPPPLAIPGPAASDSRVVLPGSPMRRPGWLNNIVPPRFRSQNADTPPSTLPPQAEVPKVPASDTPTKPPPTQPAPKIDPTKPRMLAVFPQTNKTVAELEGLLEICFPYGEKLPPLSDFSVANLRRTLQERHRTYRSPDSTFVHTIASANDPTAITYAVCVHLPLFPDEESGGGPENIGGDGEKLPSHGCISLLSAYPFFSLFFKVVFGIASIWESRRKEYVQDFAIALREKKKPPTPLTVKDFVDHFNSVMKRMKDMRVPAMGGWSRLLLAPQYTPLAFHRPHSESVKAERRMLVLEYAAPMLFALLSVDQVLFLLGCLCCERKILVVSDHANIVSSCVLALITLLEPLQWAGPVITLLPPRLDELLEAPVPLIAGRVSINSATIPNFSTLTKPMNGVIEMNMDQNNLCMHEEDLMCYHELKLPGCDTLVHELQYLSTQLFERHLSPDFPTIEQMHACDIICARIHHHMRAICALATGEATTLEISSPLYSASPRRQAPVAPTDPSWASQCSEGVLDYIRRFQDTQMFSMFKLQRQDEKDEEDVPLDDDDDDDNAGDERDSVRHSLAGAESSDEGEGAGDASEAETLFTDETVTYEAMG